MTTEKINGQNFIIGSRRHILYKKYFQDEFIKDSLNSNDKLARYLTLNKIARETNIPLKYVIWYYSKVKKGFNVTLTRVTEQTPLNNEEQTNKYNQILDLTIKEEDNGLFLYAKTCKEYEDYLIKTKELRNTENLLNENKDGQFYYLRLVDNYLDSVNDDIFRLGQINFAILRLKGISNGLKFKINNLMTEKQIKDGLNKLNDVFKEFYKYNIDKIKVDYSVKLLEEKDGVKNDN